MENASKALIIAGAILISILLISIGIILINSGRDVTSTGTQGMQSQKIETFNAQFTAYEGKHKGSEITGLINKVNSSNATDSEHKVQVYVSTALYNAGLKSAGDLNSTKTYTVSVHYEGDPEISGSCTSILTPNPNNSESGYVDYVTIK